jgi:putative DNA primase/helicase
MNGVIDLQTGGMRPSRPGGEYVKTFAPTRWEGIDALCPTWTEFLNSTFGGDGEIIGYMARLAGYAITGLTSEAVLPILWGAGRNGKTVLVQALGDVLGADLAGPIEAEMLLEGRFSRHAGGPASDLMHLRGRRLAWLSETNENRRLNAGRVKLLTGGDLITGRPPYGVRQITFRPTHKIFLLTNHRPKADATDEALWRRVCLVPFPFKFVPDPAKADERLADPALPEKLRAEASGILAWLVRGCLAWQKDGLIPPASLKEATQEYHDEEDTIKLFIDEKCFEGPGYVARASAIYDAYRAWAEKNSEKPMTGTKFGKRISELYDSDKDMNGKYYIGIGLIL